MSDQKAPPTGAGRPPSPNQDDESQLMQNIRLQAYQPTFQPSGQTSNVPAFLRGEASGPTYRASGGTDCFEDYGAPQPLFNGSRSKSFTPPPLSFSSHNDEYSGWSSTLQPPGPVKSKALDADFGNMSLNATPTLQPSLTPMNEEQDIDSSDDEFADSDLATHSSPSAHLLPPEPMFVQSPSLVLTSVHGDADAILTNISAAFTQRTDFHIENKTKKIRAVMCSERGDRVSFSIQLVAGAGQQYIAEFQRKSGSQMLFLDAFNHITDALSKNGFYSDVVAKNPAADMSTSLAASTAPATAAADLCLDDSSVTMLVEMCNSEFDDVKKEALKTIASLSGTPSAQTKINSATKGSPALLQAVANVHKSKDMDTRWYATGLVANLCNVDEFCASSVVVLLPMLFALLASPSACLLGRDVKRQAAQALQAATKRQPNLLAQCGGGEMGQYLNVLSNHFNDADPTVQAAVHTIIGQLSG